MSPDEFFQSDHWLASTKSFHLMGQQAFTGIGFDIEGACRLRDRITGMMTEIENEVEPKLPPRPLNKGELKEYCIPAKPWKKDGTLSSTFEKWMEKVGAKLYTQRDIKIGDEVFPIVGGTETITTGVMRLGNQDAIKEWLLAQGWEPTIWNFKKDARGKPVRDEKNQLILTSPKFHDKGVLCPNLEAMEGDLVKDVVKWLSLRNRKSVIIGSKEDKGWLVNERLNFDGRLSAGSSGITPTSRQKHVTICNIPKAEDGVLLGKEMRSLFIAKRPGYILVGYDASALENRVEAHYCYPYPGGKEHAEEILNGDPHTKNAFKAFYTEELADLNLSIDMEGIKEHPVFKPFRSKSKNGRYALAYGAQGPKLAATLGKPKNQGQAIFDAFWDANPALKALKEKITLFWETKGDKKWIPGIDGRRVQCRSKHSIVNYLFQSCGAIAMDYSMLYMDKWLGGIKLDKDGYPCYVYKDSEVYRCIYNHDEYLWEVPEHLTVEIGEMGVRSIESAGRMLKMRVPLTGEYKVGSSWASTH